MQVQPYTTGVYDLLLGQRVPDLIQGNIASSNQLFTYCPKANSMIFVAHGKFAYQYLQETSHIISC